MPKLRVHNFSMSVDGYAAGPAQGRDTPLGVGGERLHEWVFETASGRSMIGADGGRTGVDDEFVAAGDVGIGATVMGRNMFGPLRDEWGDSDWRGWWGSDPPYHHAVFVLTHYPRDPIEMDGGTAFHFVTDGIEAALERAYAAADGQDVRLGGGPSTVQQYLRAGLVDEMHLVIAPTLLGQGERVFDNLGSDAGGLEVVQVVCSPAVVHVRLARR